MKDAQGHCPKSRPDPRASHYQASNISGEEIIASNSTNTAIYGNTGSDIIIGGAGNDYLSGGQGMTRNLAGTTILIALEKTIYNGKRRNLMRVDFETLRGAA